MKKRKDDAMIRAPDVILPMGGEGVPNWMLQREGEDNSGISDEAFQLAIQQQLQEQNQFDDAEQFDPNRMSLAGQGLMAPTGRGLFDERDRQIPGDDYILAEEAAQLRAQYENAQKDDQTRNFQGQRESFEETTLPSSPSFEEPYMLQRPPPQIPLRYGQRLKLR